ncbi:MULTISPECIES: hypothetical protein [unclassified Streptomyces]|uniref:hypothetical protein n=1 Tax=unclassified Streptomyces TaxID=2593676 RepID=UPI00403CD806
MPDSFGEGVLCLIDRNGSYPLGLLGHSPRPRPRSTCSRITVLIAVMRDVALAVLVALFTLAERTRDHRLLAVSAALSTLASSEFLTARHRRNPV